MGNASASGRSTLSSQYFLYFGIMGVFLPYFNLYCYKLGFTGFQIGIISALRSVVMIISPLLLSVVADRFQARKPIYLSCNFIGAAIWSLYPFTSDFWPMLAVTFCYTIFYSPIISFLEAFTIDILGTMKKSYGSIRVWGTIAFIVTVYLLGRALDNYPIRIILYLILAGSLVQALFAIMIPDIKPVARKPFLNEVQTLIKRKRVIFFLVSAFLMLVSHGAYYGFFSIHLENLGYGRTFIGTAWAIASIAEIIVMINSDRIFKRFSTDTIITVAFVTAAARWSSLSLAKSPALILVSQTSHALTYGAFHIASILYIDSLTSNETKTLGQSLNNAVTYGFGLMVGFFLSGLIYEQAGSFALFAFSSLIALSGGIFFTLFKASD